jgi:hypothetical protein
MVLYISEKLTTASGGSVNSKRDLLALISYFGQERVLEYYVESPNINPIRKLIREIRYMNILGIDYNRVDEILSLIKSKHVKLVWLDNSNLGMLAKVIKTAFPQTKVITYFQNVEIKFMWDQLKLTYNPKFIHRVFLSMKNEKYACLYSDRIVCLNTRDAKGIKAIYSRDADELIPISLEMGRVKESHNNNKPNITALFLGSYFPPNVDGIRKFISRVLPRVSINLIVAGSGMEILKKEFQETDKLKIYGFVDDLAELYASVNFIVMPIFYGSGMKVKTAEALRYGKYIFGTSEAFEGYNLSEREGCLCDQIEDFVHNINKLSDSISPYNSSSREVFVQHYSNPAAQVKFNTLFASLDL